MRAGLVGALAMVAAVGCGRSLAQPAPDAGVVRGESGLCPARAPALRPLSASVKRRVRPSFRMGPFAVGGERASLFWLGDESRQLEELVLDARGVVVGAPRAVLPTKLSRDGTRVASDGRCVGIASVLWRDQHDRAVTFARSCGGTMSPEIELARTRGDAVVLAPGSGGRFGIAWTEDAGMSDNHLGFAIVGADGATVEASGRILEHVWYEGMSLVGLEEDGWLLVGARSSMDPRGRLLAVRIDARGRYVDHGEIVRVGAPASRIVAPVAARNGDDIVIAFGYGYDLALVRVDRQGAPRGPAVLLERYGRVPRGDIGGGLLPGSLRFDRGVWWVAYERRAGESSGRPMSYRTKVLATDGTRVGPVLHVVDPARSSLAVSIAPAAGGGSLVAAYEAPWSGNDTIRTFAL